MPKRVVVLGGGIAGLSCAFYLSQAAKQSKITIIECNRLGGWIQTVRTPHVSELGPRTLRPSGIAGANTLELVHSLGLEQQVVSVSKAAPASRNRFILADGALHKMPSSLWQLFWSSAPMLKGILPALAREFWMPRGQSPESLDSFVSRRLSKSISDRIVSAVIHGIYAGDHTKLEIESTMPYLKQLEQNYGSITMGLVRTMFSKQEAFKARSREASEFIARIVNGSSIYSFKVTPLIRMECRL